MKTLIRFALVVVSLCIIANAQSTVTATSPVNHALNVSASTTIQVTFSDAMLPSSFNDTTSFIVSGMTSGRHRGAIVLSSGNTVATFTSTVAFSKGEIVTVDLTSNLQNAGSTAITPFVYAFTVITNVASGTFAAKVDYMVSTEVYNAKDVLIYDVDSDGDGDLVVSNDSISILKNNGDGTFAENANYVTGATPYAISIGDLDGDGDGDIAAVVSPNILAILKNNGDGTFAGKVEYATSTSPTSLFIGDIDGDGDGDIAVGCSISGVLSILMNNGDGTFAPRIDYLNVSSGYDLFISDLDGDGDGDIAATSGVSNTVAIMKNNGDGTFAAKSEYAVELDPFSFFVSDLDSDGDGDVAVSNHFSNTVSILKNNGDGTFAAKVDYALGTGTAPQSVAITDLDGDGDGDIVVGCDSINTVYVLKNNGDGIFAAKVGYTIGSHTLSVAVGDVNGDGISDIATANFPESTVSILLGQAGPSVTTNDASNISVSTATVNGTVNANNASTTVRFLYGTVSGTYTDSITASQSPVNGTTSTPVTGSLSGLTFSTTYYFRVAASNVDGYTRGGELSFTTTNSAVPSVITNAASHIGASTARANATVNANNASTTVRFLYGTTSGIYTDSVTAIQSPVSGTVNTAVNGLLSSLDSNVTYYFRVAASNVNGYIRGSELSFTTDSTSSASDYALQFDGVNDYVSMGNQSAFSVGSELTYEAWINPYESHSGWVITKWQAFTEDKQLILHGNRVYFYLHNVFSGALLYSVSTIPFNQFTHIAATYGGGVAKLYINGVLDTSKSVGSSVGNGSGNLFIGANPDRAGESSVYPFKGIIDEVRIWNVVRTESEIQAAMNQHLNGIESGLVAYWNFEEGTGTTTADITDNGNDGSVNGATWVSSTTLLPAGPSVTTNSATSISFETARVNGIVCANNASTTVRFLYGAVSGVYTDSVAAAQSPITGFENNVVFAELSGLDSNTTYYFRVTATNANGYVRGSELSFATTIDSSFSGYALRFDGDDVVSSSLVTTVTNNLTMEGWVKWDGGTDANQLIIYNGHPGLSGYGIVLNPFTLPDSNLGILCGGVAYMTSTPTVTVNVWHHVAAVRASGVWKLYLDGVQLALNNSSVVPNTPASTTVMGQNYFKGTLDEIRVWNVARTESEIQSAMYQTLNGNETGLVAYWNYDEGSGTTTADMSSNGNDGNINGAIWVGFGVPLPVELTSFSASVKQGKVELQWKTATEVNNYGFEVQKSEVGSQYSEVSSQISDKNYPLWENVGFVEGGGSSNSPKEYSFIDSKLNTGKYTYRLKQIDNDGKFEYSQEVEVTIAQVPQMFALMQNYPNPFNPTTNIQFSIPNAQFVTLKVYDLIGREAATLVNEVKETGIYSVQFDASKLSSGIYFARLNNGDKMQMKKMMLLK